MSEPRSYPNLIIEGSPEELETALTLLFDSGCLGTESSATGREHAYFPPDTDLSELHHALAMHFPSLRCSFAEPLTEQDWLSTWKEGFRGFALGERFFILPSWEDPPRTERILLRIDPQRAFGTGTHETTRLCLELIEELAVPKSPVIDVGTGTGILAMAAAKLGCRPVLAIDSDSDAASCARSNIRRNRVAHVVRIKVSSIWDSRPSPASMVVANLNWTVLRESWTHLASWVRPDGVLVVSGLLADQVDAFFEHLPVLFDLAQQRTAGDWAALVLRRRHHA